MTRAVPPRSRAAFWLRVDTSPPRAREAWGTARRAPLGTLKTTLLSPGVGHPGDEAGGRATVSTGSGVASVQPGRSHCLSPGEERQTQVLIKTEGGVAGGGGRRDGPGGLAVVSEQDTRHVTPMAPSSQAPFRTLRLWRRAGRGLPVSDGRLQGPLGEV